MAWLTANWVWVLIFIAFIGMHLVGHGGHGGHGAHSGGGARQTDGNEGDKDEYQRRSVTRTLGGHQH